MFSVPLKSRTTRVLRLRLVIIFTIKTESVVGVTLHNIYIENATALTINTYFQVIRGLLTTVIN